MLGRWASVLACGLGMGNSVMGNSISKIANIASLALPVVTQDLAGISTFERHLRIDGQTDDISRICEYPSLLQTTTTKSLPISVSFGHGDIADEDSITDQIMSKASLTSLSWALVRAGFRLYGTLDTSTWAGALNHALP